MKLKKITSAIAALAMTAAMGVSAMSASAADAYDTSNTYLGDGGFCYSTDGVNYTTPAPHGMYDGCIDGDITVDTSTNCASFNLKDGTFTIGGNTYSGYVDGIYTDAACTNNIATDTDFNGKVDTVTSMNTGNVYYIKIVIIIGTYQHQIIPVKLYIS